MTGPGRFERDPRTLARHSDPSTSHAAASDVWAIRGNHCRRVYEAIVAAGPSGATWAEAGSRAEVEQAWRRTSDLKNQGMIRPSGLERVLPSGRKGIVWVAVARDPEPLRLPV